MTTISEALRAQIVASGLTAYQLSAESGVEASVLSRFLAEERDIRLQTADKLAAALGGELKFSRRRKPKT